MVLTALALSVLLLMTGLGVDVGYLRYQKQQMQKAADAGALGGAAALGYGGDWNAAAVNDVNANGFTITKTNGLTITVNNPPTSGPFAGIPGADNYVEVIVAQNQPTFFLKVTGRDSVPVRARAVAGLIPREGCIYVLDPSPSDSNDLVVSGSGQIRSNCGVYVDSPSTAGFVVSGGSCISADSINIVASGYSASRGKCPNGGISPYPPKKIKSFKNPLAWLQPPTPISCITQGQHQTVFYPTAYCGGIKINGGTATFNPGTYILAGGGLTIQGGATVTGTGVTFFNTGTAPYNDYRGFNISSGNSVVRLSAPIQGATAGIPGILFFEDPNIPWLNVGKSQISQVTGGANTALTGAFYLPTTKLTYSGGSSEVNYTQIVAYQLEVSGPSTIDTSLVHGGSPIHNPALVE
jgi:hypothetical protein